MSAAFCASCGTAIPRGDRFCGYCGRAVLRAGGSVPMGPPYWWRLQIDPMSPMPRRDVRYVMIVTGIALTILGLLLLAVSAIITDAISAAAGPSAVDPGTWFTWIALPFLGVGLALLIVGVWWGLRPGAVPS